MFQEVAEHKSDVFQDFEAGRDSKKMLSASCHISAVQVVIRILQVSLNHPVHPSIQTKLAVAEGIFLPFLLHDVLLFYDKYYFL